MEWDGPGCTPVVVCSHVSPSCYVLRPSTSIQVSLLRVTETSFLVRSSHDLANACCISATFLFLYLFACSLTIHEKKITEMKKNWGKKREKCKRERYNKIPATYTVRLALATRAEFDSMTRSDSTVAEYWTKFSSSYGQDHYLRDTESRSQSTLCQKYILFRKPTFFFSIMIKICLNLGIYH